ncbi:MAG: DUF4492 domain-containing protein [Bacteroidales bacterium]
MQHRITNIPERIFRIAAEVVQHIYGIFRNSKTARLLFLILVIKLSIFYGFFKSYWFPVHLEPKWESEQHQIDEVTERIINTPKNNHDD